ncbi:MAG: CcdB family protein [Proteobacteria bacterium]|uniref:CcdB family protein n=1 Tax=Rudaea sp. TaxID=2136325 RepID=UPI0037849604|nr:CcdB family protein [Pseudomonadota bacterium]
MNRFDVVRNGDSASQRRVPYLLIVQSELLADFPTHVVVPLIRQKGVGSTPASLLNPRFDIENETLVMFTQQLAGLPKRYLGKLVCNLEAQQNTIVRALDFLFDGI